MSDWQTVYSDVYTDGSKIRVELNEENSMIALSLLPIGAPEPAKFILGQRQALDISFGMMKAINVFEHQHADREKQPAGSAK